MFYSRRLQTFPTFILTFILAFTLSFGAAATGGGGRDPVNAESTPPTSFDNDGKDGGGITVPNPPRAPVNHVTHPSQIKTGEAAWSQSASPALQKAWASHGEAAYQNVTSNPFSAVSQEAAQAISAGDNSGLGSSAQDAWGSVSSDQGASVSISGGLVGHVSATQSSAISAAKSKTGLPNLAPSK